MWAKLEILPCFAVHFGYDYYMYIGIHDDNYQVIEHLNTGLFIEEFDSYAV
ncbi:hypothetical protein FACS189499_02580 [Clostridia bacterium]|nr:hypothetical protein FACS189499_02580 [Clostridia bacterium]